MDFKALKELAQTITRYKIAKIEVMGNPRQRHGRMEKLYDGLLSDAFKDDDEAGKALFGTEDFDRNQYRRIKNRLERQLINTALFVDTNRPHFTERSTAYHQCYFDFAAAQILLMRGAASAGVEVMERTLEMVQKYEFINLGAEITLALRRQYARAKSNASKHNLYSRLHKEFELKRRWEMLAMDYHEELVHYYVGHRIPDPEICQKATDFRAELLPLLPQVDTAQFSFHTHQIGIIQYFAINDCGEALKICEVSSKYLLDHPNANRDFIVGVLAQKMLCLIQLRHFDASEVLSTMNIYWAMVEFGAYNWFLGKELLLFYYLHTRQYEAALRTFSEGYKHERFHTLTGNVRDKWYLYAGYLHLLADLGQLDKAAVEASAGPYRYAKLVNEFAVLDKEKMGMNIPLAILPLLVSLAKSEAEYPEEYLTSVERYRRRYLKEDLNLRSACFAKLLLLLAQKPFEDKNLGAKIRKALQALREAPVHLSRQTIAVEVVPYEDLWEWLTGERV